MSGLVDIRPVDREFYASRLRGFVPERVIDFHVHIRPADKPRAVPPGVAAWAMAAGAPCRIEQVREAYGLMLPGVSVAPLVFGNPLRVDRVEANNAYVGAAAEQAGVPALLMNLPDWPTGDLEGRLDEHGFVGVKPYFTLAPHRPPNEVCIFDFLPPHQLEALDRRKAIVMLHLPRPGRLADPCNVRQLLEIARGYPRLGLVAAHVGRAYCVEDLGTALEALGPAEGVCFDISANTNAEVFRRLIAAVGPRRILFGSDLPITRMRMRRICDAGRYVNLVPRGLYGDLAGDPHVREVEAPLADELTLFLYEELDAFRRAAETAGLGEAEVRDVFFGNAQRLLSAARGGMSPDPTGQRRVPRPEGA